jgi:hypothetical protein
LAYFKIPLDPPLKKGEVYVPPFVKEARGDFSGLHSQKQKLFIKKPKPHIFKNESFKC